MLRTYWGGGNLHPWGWVWWLVRSLAGNQSSMRHQEPSLHKDPGWGRLPARHVPTHRLQVRCRGCGRHEPPRSSMRFGCGREFREVLQELIG
jgi:hypothetical protein